MYSILGVKLDFIMADEIWGFLLEPARILNVLQSSFAEPSSLQSATYMYHIRVGSCDVLITLLLHISDVRV